MAWGQQREITVRQKLNITLLPTLFDVPSINTARFLEFAKALLHPPHRYDGDAIPTSWTGVEARARVRMRLMRQDFQEGNAAVLTTNNWLVTVTRSSEA